MSHFGLNVSAVISLQTSCHTKWKKSHFIWKVSFHRTSAKSFKPWRREALDCGAMMLTVVISIGSSSRNNEMIMQTFKTHEAKRRISWSYEPGCTVNKVRQGWRHNNSKQKAQQKPERAFLIWRWLLSDGRQPLLFCLFVWCLCNPQGPVTQHSFCFITATKAWLTLFEIVCFRYNESNYSGVLRTENQRCLDRTEVKLFRNNCSFVMTWASGQGCLLEHEPKVWVWVKLLVITAALSQTTATRSLLNIYRSGDMDQVIIKLSIPARYGLIIVH